VIAEWESLLQKSGFAYKRLAFSEKALFKYIGSIQQQIWEQAVVNDGKKILINVCISISDPFREEEASYIPILAYRLATDGVVLPKSDTGVGRFWKKEESLEAKNSLINYALPWFEENSTLERLIDLVTNDVVVSPVYDKNKPNKIWQIRDFFMSNNKKQNECEVIVPIMNHLLLSLLYYHSGNNVLSCEHANEWMKHCKSRPGEPERTLRQLKEMGCS